MLRSVQLIGLIFLPSFRKMYESAFSSALWAVLVWWARLEPLRQHRTVADYNTLVCLYPLGYIDSAV